MGFEEDIAEIRRKLAGAAAPKAPTKKTGQEAVEAAFQSASRSRSEFAADLDEIRRKLGASTGSTPTHVSPKTSIDEILSAPKAPPSPAQREAIQGILDRVAKQRGGDLAAQLAKHPTVVDRVAKVASDMGFDDIEAAERSHHAIAPYDRGPNYRLRSPRPNSSAEDLFEIAERGAVNSTDSTKIRQLISRTPPQDIGVVTGNLIARGHTQAAEIYTQHASRVLPPEEFSLAVTTRDEVSRSPKLLEGVKATKTRAGALGDAENLFKSAGPSNDELRAIEAAGEPNTAGLLDDIEPDKPARGGKSKLRKAAKLSKLLPGLLGGFAAGAAVDYFRRRKLEGSEPGEL